MKKYLILGIILLFSILVIAGKPDTSLVPATNNKAEVSVVIPLHAVQVADGVFSLGTAQDVDGRTVQGFLFVDKRKENAKPGTSCGNGICESGENARKCPADCGSGGGDTTSTCFAFLGKGAKWKTTEQYVSSGVDTTLTETSLNAWDSEVSFDIFGTRDTTGTTDGADLESPDGKNEVEFASLGETNTIAHAIVWGIFIGPPKGRELVEWDVEFNSDYAFGDASSDPTVMDYQNIATHEFGHALGLGHPDDSCTEETMYAFADFGETKKRTLEAGDIAGISKLYS